MGFEWAGSADKHKVPRADALYAMTHPEVQVELGGGKPGETLTLYIGHPHGQTDRYLEVIAAHRRPRTIAVLHVMPLSDLYRHLLSEEE